MKHGWEIKKQGEVCTFKGVGTPSKSNASYYSGNIPEISSDDGVNIAAPTKHQSSTSPVPVQYQSLKDRILELLQEGELPIAIISQKLGQRRVSGQLKIVLKTMVNDSLIKMTIPEKPNSRLQKYRLINIDPQNNAGKKVVKETKR